MKPLIVLAIVSTFLSFVIGAIELEDVANTCENETLILSFTGPASFDRNFISPSTLRCIIIRSVGVNIEDGSFENVPNLEYLDLRENRISGDNLFSFGSISQLKVLNLDHQGIDEYYWEAVISSEYPKLEYLDLSYTSINNIRISEDNPWLNPFPNLIDLNLSGNYISSSLSMTLPSTLMYLDLSKNNISEFSFTGLNNLLSLTLDNNNIESLSSYYVDLKPLQNLKYLSITNNQISYIYSDSIENLFNLQYLDLSGNSLSNLDFNVIKDLHLLQVLLLDSNSIDTISVPVPLNITTLSLNCNRIVHVTFNSFYNLRNLQKLFLSGNAIQDIDVDSFQNNQLLEELYLDDNDLSHLPPNWCQSTSKLRYLNLSGNKFTSLESVLYTSNLPVTELYFERNPVTYINAGLLEISPKTMIFLNIDSTSRRVLCPTNGIEEERTLE